MFPDYLSFSCDSDETENQILNIFLILYSINHYIIVLFPTAIEVEYFGARVTYKIPTDEVRNLSKVFNYLEKGTVLSAKIFSFNLCNFCQKLFIPEVTLQVFSWIYCFSQCFYKPVWLFLFWYNHSHYFPYTLKYLMFSG